MFRNMNYYVFNLTSRKPSSVRLFDVRSEVSFLDIKNTMPNYTMHKLCTVITTSKAKKLTYSPSFARDINQHEKCAKSLGKT